MRRILAACAVAVALAAPATAVAFALPNDPLAPRQWYLGRDRALDIFDAANQLFPVRVAVIDSGIDVGHPELRGRIVAWKSFVGGTMNDQFGHGTFVAGEIAAIADNGAGIAGIAPPARLVIAKVVKPDGTIPPKAEARAIRWAVQPARACNQPQLRQRSRPRERGQRRLLVRGAARDRVRGPTRRPRGRGSRERHRRAVQAVAVRELPGRVPARARRLDVRQERPRPDVLEPRRPVRRHLRAGDGHRLAVPALADEELPRVRRPGLLRLRHEGVPQRQRHVVLGAAGHRGRRAAPRRGPRAAPGPGLPDPADERRRRETCQRLRRVHGLARMR